MSASSAMRASALHVVCRRVCRTSTRHATCSLSHSSIVPGGPAIATLYRVYLLYLLLHIYSRLQFSSQLLYSSVSAFGPSTEPNRLPHRSISFSRPLPFTTTTSILTLSMTHDSSTATIDLPFTERLSQGGLSPDLQQPRYAPLDASLSF